MLRRWRRRFGGPGGAAPLPQAGGGPLSRDEQAKEIAKANCWDNAPAESSFGTLKTEPVNAHRCTTREEAKRDLFAYIEGYYNRRRLHAARGTITAQQAELRAA